MKAWIKKHAILLASLALALPLGVILTQLAVLGSADVRVLSIASTVYATTLIVNMIAATAMSVLALIALNMQGKDAVRLRALFLVALAGAHMAGVHLIALLVAMPDTLLLFLDAGLLMLVATGGLVGMLTTLPSAKTLTWRAATGVIGLIALTALLFPLSNNLIQAKTALFSCFIWAQLALAAALPLHALLQYAKHHGKPPAHPERPDAASWSIWAQALMLLALGFALDLDGMHVEAFTLGWIPLAWIATRSIRERTKEIRDNEFISSLPTAQARRFLLRYAVEESAWAATVGMRTVNFIIDHDPYDASLPRLTATLDHIRKEEIERFIEPILANKLLYKKVLGNRIHGTIDPEFSIRPCMDVLTLFCCVYLDAVPLIERRLKNLTALFPIIDPDLAKAVTPRDIENSHGRMEWLFYFDYEWVDQQIVGTMTKTRYGVNVSDLSFTTRGKMLRYLEDKNRMGNFIWISEQARERIVLEAPYLSSIVEAWPLTEEGEGKVVHFIRFEELIPRIQKYFNLEEMRRIMRDYDVSAEGQKFLNMLELHVDQADTPQKLLDVMSAMMQHNWHGFKERDHALHLILKAYERSQYFFLAETPRPDVRETYRRKFQEVIEQVGFPGQLLYNAHVAKRAIRVAEKLAKICLDVRHRRFVEGWLFLSTLQGDRLPEEELVDYLGIIAKAMEVSVKDHPLVRQKAVEAFFNIAAHVRHEEHHVMIAQMVNRLAYYIAIQKADVELCCFFVDAKIHLEESLNKAFKLEQTVLQFVSDYFMSLAREFPPRSSEVSALTSRLRLLQHAEEAAA